MALKVIVDTLDELPEPLREHYKPDDEGRYRLVADENGADPFDHRRKALDLQERLEAIDQKRKAAEGSLMDFAMSKTVAKLAAEAGLPSDEPTSNFLVHLAKSKGWKLDGDRLIAVDGKGRLIYSAGGEIPLNFKRWLKSDEVRAAAPFLFNRGGADDGGADGAGGGRSSPGGHRPASGSSEGAGGRRRSRMTTSEKSAFIRAHGQAKYLSLPD